MNTKIRKNLAGPNVRRFRKDREWTQHRLAMSLQSWGFPISRSTIASIETQRRPVTDYQLACIARALQVPLFMFFFGEANTVDRHPQSRLKSPRPDSP